VGSGPLALPGERDLVERHTFQLDADPLRSGHVGELPVRLVWRRDAYLSLAANRFRDLASQHFGAGTTA
jgi:hypothetical protein